VNMASGEHEPVAGVWDGALSGVHWQGDGGKPPTPEDGGI